MALTKAAIRKARAVRIALAAAVDATTAALTLAWASAWEEIVAEWAAAVDELLVLGAGEWPTRAQISRATRATNALRVTAERLSELAKRSGVTISGDMQTIVRAAGEWERGVITTQLPTGISFSWAEVDETALDAIVKRSTGRIESSLRPLPREQSAVMRHTLIRGVAVGDNPNAVASLMLKRLRGVFDGGLVRARLIARTEMHDAQRASALQSRKANAEVVEGWRWMSTQSSRTCPACLAMDGSLHPVDELGPAGHPNCRCCAVPVTKSWRALGIDLDEPADTYQDGRAWFAEQPQSVQVQIMGRDRLDRLNSGLLTWDQIPMIRQSPDWRDSVVVRPLAA